MKISCYMDGGIGDVLLGHKLAWILKSTVYKDAEFTAFLDTEGNKMQERVLKHLFPNFYKEIFTIPSKRYKELWIDSQFGQEKVKSFIENVPQEWHDKIISYDKSYNFHIDALEWLVYPELEWVKYFTQFPKPEIKEANHCGNYIMSHLISTTGTEHVMDDWYHEKLVSDIDQLCQKLDYQHFIVSTPDLNARYDKAISKCQKTTILNGEVEDVCDMISNCRALIGVDSAWRLVSHFFDKPTITLSKNCNGRGGVPLSHKIRWLPFPETTFGLHHPTQEIIKLLQNMLVDKMFIFAPELSLTDRPINDIFIKRDYKINHEKSILNEN